MKPRAPFFGVVLGALLAVGSGGLSGQDALVLSGGGARGIAHAGVVRALDSLGVDPDIVVGTSMGAVVGALYAAGLDGEALWTEIVDQEWTTMFDPFPLSDGPDWEGRLPALRLELSGSRSRSVKGLVADWRVNRLLTHTLFEAGARARSDFDRLPRRYRAVAVDLETGEAVVLDRGDLARAVRTSMAIPGVFAAVPSADRVLIDGGIADYLPVDAALAMGAQWVIASDVVMPTAILDPRTPATIGARGFQWLNVNARQGDGVADVTVYPPLESTVTSASFLSDVRAIARVGYESAVGVPLPPSAGRSPRADEAPIPGEGAQPGTLPGAISGLDVLVGDSALRSLLRGAFAGAVGADRPEPVLAALDRVYATGLFDGVWPSLAWSESGGDPVLRIEADATVPAALLGGVGYDVDRGGRVWMTARQRVGLSGLAGRATVGGFLGELERYGSASLSVHPSGWVPLSATAEGHVAERSVRFAIPEGGTEKVLRFGGSLGLEWRLLDPDRALTGRIVAEYVEVAGDGGAAWGPDLRWGDLAPLGAVLGTPDRLEALFRTGFWDYWAVRARGSREWSTSGVRIAVVGDVRVSGGDPPPDVRPALGTGSLMPGLAWGEERGRSTYVGGMDVGYPVPLAGVARLRLRGGWLEGLAEHGTEDGATWGAEIGGVWRTPFASVELGLGVSSEGQWRMDFGLGSLW